MSKQQNLFKFLKPVQQKRALCDTTVDNVKKPKMDSVEDINEEKFNEYCSKFPILDREMGKSWFNALEPQISQSYFSSLNDFLLKEREKYTIYPPKDQVWSWTKLCSLNDVKVVILGQDPYHNPGQAHGLCFSVQKGTHPPPSLINMYKELENDIPGFKRPNHGDLSHWAKQGVLLLNACLTVRQNQPNSHTDKGWEKITDAVIKIINERKRNVVFLLWGNFAQKKAALVDKQKHHVLKTVHPSPLSANRGFFGCKHFSTTNKLLEDSGKDIINWCFPNV